ncbi:MAG: L-rhamnose mutarotase [Spirochaetales bacterium]|nr:L-rhamnose mutarotase [Spirochaetales bacterium]
MRVLFKMRVHPGKIAEYKKRHDEIWPDLVQELKAAGLSEFSIAYDKETEFLFAFHKQDEEKGSGNQPGGEVQRRWWKFMEPLMECNEDSSPKIWPLEEVFYMP